MRTWGTVVVGILFAGLAIFTVIYNNDPVVVVMPFIKWPTKLWGAMVASAVLGAVASMLLVTWPLLRMKLQSRKHSRRIAELEQEVHGLRTLPIASDSSATARTQQKV